MPVAADRRQPSEAAGFHQRAQEATTADMAAVNITFPFLRSLKTAMRESTANCQSAHVSEGLAAAFGWRTHAAMRAGILHGSATRTVDAQAYVSRCRP